MKHSCCYHCYQIIMNALHCMHASHAEWIRLSHALLAALLYCSQMEKANQRIKILQHDLAKIAATKAKAAADDDDSDDDDDLDDTEGIRAEIAEREKTLATHQAKLDEYAKHKKWNVDNLCQVKEERTYINPGAANVSYTPTGFANPSDTYEPPVKSAGSAATAAPPKAAAAADKEPTASAPAKTTTTTTAAPAPAKPAAASTAVSTTKSSTAVGPFKEPAEVGAFETYPEFTDKYAETIEYFMRIPDFEGSKDYLLKYGDILLQENAANYLLLATLEDEMNGHREKMKQTARQSQFISNIAELAKTLHTHPGNCIQPFFSRLQQREHVADFLTGLKTFQDKIIERAVVKKAEIDAERGAEDEQGHNLTDIPREERLGPGGLDPLEVIETLPPEMVAAFESRDVDQLKQVLMTLDPEDAERHMKRCVDSGLWTANA
jgi:cell division cycle protein 37